jgi:hypothetical protein
MLAFLLLMSLVDQPCPTLDQLADPNRPSHYSSYPVECMLVWDDSKPVLLNASQAECDRRAAHVPRTGEIWEAPNICVLYKSPDCSWQKDFTISGTPKVKGKSDRKR